MIKELDLRKPVRQIQDLAVRYKVVFILILLVLIAASQSPVFFTSSNILSVIRQIAASSIIGVGFTLVLASGQIDLSVGSMLGLIGVLTAMFSKIPGMPLVATLIFAVACGMILGGFNAFLVNALTVPAFIATLSTMSVFRGVVYIVTDMNPVSNLPEYMLFFGQGYWGPIPFPIILLIIIAVLGFILLNRTTFGRRAIAMGGNAEAARVCGINLKVIRYLVYMTMGAFTAFAALVMTGRVASAQTGAGQGMELDAVAAVVIGGTPLTGGVGNVPGTIIGCLIVGVINNILNLTGVNSNWQLVIKGALIIVAIFLDVQSSKIRETILHKRKSAGK